MIVPIWGRKRIQEKGKHIRNGIRAWDKRTSLVISEHEHAGHRRCAETEIGIEHGRS
jgi:hypothetical protein